jgi:hypothetical protein
LKKIEFNLGDVNIFEFVQLYLNCFWNLYQKKFQSGEKLIENCERIIDFIYFNNQFFDLELNLLICSIILSSSLLITKDFQSSSCLLTWISHISGIAEFLILKSSYNLLFHIIGEKVVDIQNFNKI